MILKKKISKKNNIKELISLKKSELDNLDNIKIEYLELRNRFTLKKTLKIKNSKIFIAYFLNKIRLIDNF